MVVQNLTVTMIISELRYVFIFLNLTDAAVIDLYLTISYLYNNIYVIK